MKGSHAQNWQRTKKWDELEYVKPTPFPAADINEKASASPVLFIITSLLFLKREKQAPQEKLQATECKETKKGAFFC